MLITHALNIPASIPHLKCILASSCRSCSASSAYLWSVSYHSELAFPLPLPLPPIFHVSSFFSASKPYPRRHQSQRPLSPSPSSTHRRSRGNLESNVSTPFQASKSAKLRLPKTGSAGASALVAKKPSQLRGWRVGWENSARFP